MTKRPVHLTNRELDVMAVLWKEGSASVAEVLDSLEADVAYTTVLKVLQTLEARGVVGHDREGRAYRYFPRVSPDAVGDRTLRRIVENIYLGSRELLIARLLEQDDVSPEELRRIRAMVATRLRDRGR